MIAPESRTLRSNVVPQAALSRFTLPLPAASTTIRPAAVAVEIASKTDEAAN